MADTRKTFIGVNAAQARQVEELIVRNRSELIKATVKDPATQKDLIAISEAILRVKGRDPDQVAAWGLGCGGGCLVSPEDIAGNPLGLKTK